MQRNGHLDRDSAYFTARQTHLRCLCILLFCYTVDQAKIIEEDFGTQCFYRLSLTPEYFSQNATGCKSPSEVSAKNGSNISSGRAILCSYVIYVHRFPGKNAFPSFSLLCMGLRQLSHHPALDNASWHLAKRFLPHALLLRMVSKPCACPRTRTLS